MTQVQAWDVARLRAVAMAIGEDVDDMRATQCRIGETCGWDDPRIAEIDLDIEKVRAERRRILDKVALLTVPTAAA